MHFTDFRQFGVGGGTIFAKPLALLVLLIPSLAQGTLIYDVSRTVGDGSVAGFIETDGSLGVLDDINIVDFGLTIMAPNLSGSPVTLSFLNNPFQIDGNSFTATLDALSFDFSASSGGSVVFAETGSGGVFWCLSDLYPCSSMSTGGSSEETIGDYPVGNLQSVLGLVGTQVIATRTVQVPEPETLTLLIAGVLGFGLVRLRRA